MGLFDRFRKKEATVVVEDTHSPQLDGTEVQKELASELQPEPIKKRKFGFIKLFLLLVFTVSSVLAALHYQKQNLFKKVESNSRGFLEMLCTNRILPAYHSHMSSIYKEEVNEGKFTNLVRGSIFLFDRLIPEKITIEQTNFTQDDGSGRLTGDLFYSDGSKGTFELQLLKQDNAQIPFSINGFKINAPERTEKVFELAYNTVFKFLDELNTGSLDHFKESLHQSVQERLDEVQIYQHHRKLMEAKFHSPEFDRNQVVTHKNVQLTYTGTVIDGNQAKHRASITLFYENNEWFILAWDFQHEA